MSVRKTYQLLVNGNVVLTGSYNSVNTAYQAMTNHYNQLLNFVDPKVLELVYGSILIAYKPNMLPTNDGFLSV